jgi:hypothetical protein
MKKQKAFVFSFILFGFLFLKSPYLQGQVETNALKAGAVIVAIEKIPLRDSPPEEGIFYSRGNPVGSIEKGEDLKITEVKRVKTLLAEQVWGKVQRSLTKLRNEEWVSGWIFLGNKGEKSCCFTIKE